MRFTIFNFHAYECTMVPFHCVAQPGHEAVIAIVIGAALLGLVLSLRRRTR